MKPLTAIITKIDEGKYSRTENMYYRIRFRLETGEFAMTDVVPTYRNFPYWQPILKAGVGTKIGGVFLKDGAWKPLKVNADSQVFIIQETLVKDPPPVDDEVMVRNEKNNKRQSVWKFESKSRPHIRYTVTDFTSYMVCDCTAYTFRKRCSHIEKVNAMIAAVESPKVENKENQYKLF